jgi:hypothetical protein
VTRVETQALPCDRTTASCVRPTARLDPRGHAMTQITLSPREAGALSRRGRLLVRHRLLTPHQFVLLDNLVWTARHPGRASMTISYCALARVTGLARSTVATGIAALERLGLLRRIRRRVLVAWGAGTASRQAANAYVLLPPNTESAPPHAREESSSTILLTSLPLAAVRAAQAALAERRQRVEQDLLRQRRGMARKDPQGSIP